VLTFTTNYFSSGRDGVFVTTYGDIVNLKLCWLTLMQILILHNIDGRMGNTAQHATSLIGHEAQLANRTVSCWHDGMVGPCMSYRPWPYAVCGVGRLQPPPRQARGEEAAGDAEARGERCGRPLGVHAREKKDRGGWRVPAAFLHRQGGRGREGAAGRLGEG
jgi:hypothetical protein